MVRGAEYDNGVPQSDNPIENGPNKAHGTGKESGELNRAHNTAPLPQQTGSGRDVYSGLPNAGAPKPTGK
ncbi:unnamed protein product [Penicillium glandicola]